MDPANSHELPVVSSPNHHVSFEERRREEQVEKAFQESQRALTTLMDNLPGMAYRCCNDAHWTMELVSQGCLELTGYPPADLLGNSRISYGELISPGDRHHVAHEVQTALENRTRFRVVYRIQTAAGADKWVWEQGCGVFSEHGDLEALEGFITDITAARLAEEDRRNFLVEQAARVAAEAAEKRAQALVEIAEREQREKSALLESTSEGIYGVDLKGCCTFVNSAGRRMLGYAPEECMGQNMHRLIHHTRQNGAPYPEEECFIFQAFREGRGVRSEHEVLWRKDGSAFPAFYSSSPILQDGALQGAVITFTDITEQKETEQALRRAKTEAENANRAKSEFLSRMSHELRTPMNSILGFGQLLARNELSDGQRRNVDQIMRAGRHLLRLINEVLELARIEANRQELSVESVRVGAVLQEAVSLVRPLAEQHDCLLVEVSSETDNLHVFADHQRLTQVLLNLLSNAIKYNRPGGSVTVFCEPAGGTGGEGGDRLRISVRDTGWGIPRERLHELFVPFSRLGAAQTQIEGTGLGLALSQRLVEAMGGQLTVQSVVGEGSTFSAELALTESPMERLANAGAESGGWEAERRSLPAATLLYIEDNLANFSLIESILGSQPHVCLIPAVEGRLGLDVARERSPDLILLDLHLPDAHGEEVLRQLRSDARTEKIPIIIISADATPSRIRRLMDAGADDYITKPLDVDGFLAAVDRALAERQLDHQRPRTGGTPDQGIASG